MGSPPTGSNWAKSPANTIFMPPNGLFGLLKHAILTDNWMHKKKKGKQYDSNSPKKSLTAACFGVNKTNERTSLA